MALKTAIPEVRRLTPDDFKVTVKGKGWTYRALAQRWHMSEVRVSQIARDADRPFYYDDAIYGLPQRDKT